MAVLDRVRILLWEEDQKFRQLADTALREAGFEVVVVDREELRIANEVNSDRDTVWVIGRCGVPDDGKVWSQWMHHVGPQTPILHLVEIEEVERISEVLHTDHSQCVVKPFTPEQLVVSVQAVLLKLHREERSTEVAGVDKSQIWDAETILEAVEEGLLGVDMMGRIRVVNAAAVKWLGCNHREEIIGRPLSEVYRLGSINAQEAKVVESFKASEESQNVQGRLVLLQRKDGEKLLIEDRGGFVKDEDGGVKGLLVRFEPVPSKDESCTKLGDADAWFDSVTDPMLIFNGEWRVQRVNEALARWLGRTHEELIDQVWWDLFPATVKELHGSGFAEAMKRKETYHVEIYLEGSGTWHEVRSYAHEEGRLVWMKDITTRKLEWERGNRMDRLESLGLLARGFAHDFNNLLTVLLGNLALAEQQVNVEEAATREIKAARQATLLAQGLVQQLLIFARGGAPVKRAASMSELLKQFFDQHSKLFGIDYQLELKGDLPVMSIDPNQIRRLIGNLVRNAEQAMPRGGRLILRGEVADAERMYGHDVLKDVPDSPVGVLLEVEDNGEGIMAKHLSHIFEPYFTTRTKHNATGLGLTVCESIARAHGGAINVYSGGFQRGTKVSLFLPLDEEEAIGFDIDSEPRAASMDDNQKKSDATAEDKSAARILVLEDDHLVRALISRGLKSQGYEVAETVDGQDTVLLYEKAMKERRPFDLVILDLSIPNGMGGVRTMEMLRGLDPQVLALVSSGYSDDPAMAQPSLYGFAAVLPKPYEPMDLIKTVKRLLSQKMGSGK